MDFYFKLLQGEYFVSRLLAVMFTTLVRTVASSNPA